MATLEKDVHIEVEDMVVKYGDLCAVNRVSFQVFRGEHLTLLGPSGCGKTTILRSIAGLETPCAGEIRIDGKPVYSSPKKINVPTEKRELSMVFQSYAIWPHMSVFDNVAYGLRVRHMHKREIEEKVMHALTLVGMTEVAKKSAAKLSGGQQQRVALARSFVFGPRVLLFDEPLSNLDAKLRAQMRIEIKEIQKSLRITSVYVTHDQEEALAISDRVIVMNVGYIEQVGPPMEIYDTPKTAFVADFIGAANIISGKVRKDLRVNGIVPVEGPHNTLVYAAVSSKVPESEAKVSIRTVYLELTPARPEGDRNVWPAKIVRRVFLGDFIQYILSWPEGELVARTSPTEVYSEGESVYIKIDPKHCVFLD